MVEPTRRTTAPKTKPSGDVAAVFAEAAERRTERDGLLLTIGDMEFPFWPSRFDYRERLMMGQHTGWTPSDLALQMLRETGTVEVFAAIIAMSQYVENHGELIDMTAALAWVEEQIFELGTKIEVTNLRVDDGSPVGPDEDVVLVGERDEVSGPN